MRINPLHPEKMNSEVRSVHNEVLNLITRSQGSVNMLDAQGSLIGPFPPMLQFSQFGIPALSFIRSLDSYGTLPKKVREVAILTVGSAFGARFELYAHEIMAQHFGFALTAISSLSSGNRPSELSEEESISYEIAHVLVKGRIIPDSTYTYAVQLLGDDGIAELIFLVGAYIMLATVLNGFDVPVPETAL